MSVPEFAARLAATSVSGRIRTISWIIPGVQVVHILAISVLVSSAVLLDLRLLGQNAGSVPVAAYVRRYGRCHGPALLLLLASGATLIVGEPSRTLGNWVFWTKMGLVLGGTAATGMLTVPLRWNKNYWDVGGRGKIAATLATLSLVIWIAAIVCGRWIAYVL